MRSINGMIGKGYDRANTTWSSSKAPCQTVYSMKIHAELSHDNSLSLPTLRASDNVKGV